MNQSQINSPEIDYSDHFEEILGVEDYLQENKVFLNGISKSPCHQDSYGTIVDFVALNKAIDSHEFPSGLIDAAIKYWEECPNTQIPLKLVVSFWKMRLT